MFYPEDFGFSNKYLNFYFKLCNLRLESPGPGQTESHHIFPKALFGSNRQTVELTPREHFLAHRLLYRALQRSKGDYHVFTIKMALAVTIMAGRSEL